jgi:AraC-like DNA-binding protein
MHILQVRSLPIKDVLQNLADALNAEVIEDCEIYRLEIPQNYGEGFIQGVNFPSGLAWLQYNCKFKKATEIRFTVNKIHPLKLLYNLSDKITHTFEDDPELHEANQFQNLIVGSKNNGGHILRFRAKRWIKLNSVEINRKRFVQELACTVDSLDSDLKEAMTDIEAKNQYYFEGPYTLKIANIFQSIDSFKYDRFVRKMFLASKSFEILAVQLLDYVDLVEATKLDTQDHELMRKIEGLVEQDFRKYGTVRAISTKLKVSEPRLQKLFRRHFDATGNEYLKKKRMDLIVEMLEDTSLSINDISRLVGIDSASYLSKIFRAKFVLSPNQYRMQMKRGDN